MPEANDSLFYEKIKKIVKYELSSVGMLPKWQKINETLSVLSLDKRREAIGTDFFIWYFDILSKPNSAWNTNFGIDVYGSQDEMLFNLLNPSTVLFSYPCFNPLLTKVMDEKSELTLLNNVQLQLFEKSFKQEVEKSSYDFLSMQEVENGTAKKFDLILISIIDIYHNLDLVINFFNLLTDNGSLAIHHVNEDGRLYAPESEYTPSYDLHQKLKNINNSLVYHNPLIAGKTIAKKRS